MGALWGQIRGTGKRRQEKMHIYKRGRVYWVEYEAGGKRYRCWNIPAFANGCRAPREPCAVFAGFEGLGARSLADCDAKSPRKQLELHLPAAVPELGRKYPQVFSGLFSRFERNYAIVSHAGSSLVVPCKWYYTTPSKWNRFSLISLSKTHTTQ